MVRQASRTKGLLVAAVAMSVVASVLVLTTRLVLPAVVLVLAAVTCLILIWRAEDRERERAGERAVEHAPSTPEPGDVARARQSEETAATLDSRDSAPTRRPMRRVPPSVEPEVVLQVLFEEAAEVGDALAAHLWLADVASGTLRLVAAVGPMAPSPQPIPLDGEDVRVRCFADGGASLAAVMSLRDGETESTVWRYVLPVSAGDARGVASVDLTSAEAPDTGALGEITASLRASLAGALGLHVAKMELGVAQALVEAARELSRVLDPGAVLTIALARAMELSQAQTGSVMLLDEDSGKLVIAVAEGLPAEVVATTALSEREGIAGWVLASGRPLLVEDLPARKRAAGRHGIRSAVSVPLADDDGVLGVLNVGSRSFPARFSESHLAALEILGRQAATALRNARATVQARELSVETLRALVLALETKDPYARGGTERVVGYAELLGEAMRLPEEDAEALRIAALLHDIGMVTVNTAIAAADRPLSTVESALLKMHPQVAADVLAEARALQQVVPLVYHHHEWFNGHGYLEGVSGEDIPLGARILAVADAFVAMTSDRPYRHALSERDALRELEEKAGTQFDPLVVETFVDVLRRGRNRVPGENEKRG